MLLQHFFAPFPSKFLVSDGNIYIKNTRVYKTTNWRGRQYIKIKKTNKTQPKKPKPHPRRLQTLMVTKAPAKEAVYYLAVIFK